MGQGYCVEMCVHGKKKKPSASLFFMYTKHHMHLLYFTWRIAIPPPWALCLSVPPVQMIFVDFAQTVEDLLKLCLLSETSVIYLSCQMLSNSHCIHFFSANIPLPLTYTVDMYLYSCCQPTYCLDHCFLILALYWNDQGGHKNTDVLISAPEILIRLA